MYINMITVECYCKECNARRIFDFKDSRIAIEILLAYCTSGSITSETCNIPKTNFILI